MTLVGMITIFLKKVYFLKNYYIVLKRTIKSVSGTQKYNVVIGGSSLPDLGQIKKY